MLLYCCFIGSLLSLYCFYYGIKLLIFQKPAVRPLKYLHLFQMIGTTPTLLFVWIMNSGGWISILYFCFLVLLSFLGLKMQGYSILGVSETSVTKAAHYSINENLTLFRNESTYTDPKHKFLKIETNSLIGSTIIRTKQKAHSKELPQIITGIINYYDLNNIRPNNFSIILHIFSGIVSLLGVILTYLYLV